MEWLQELRSAVWAVSVDDALCEDLKTCVDLISQLVECEVVRQMARAYPVNFSDPGPCSECPARCRDLL